MSSALATDCITSQHSLTKQTSLSLNCATASAGLVASKILH